MKPVVLNPKLLGEKTEHLRDELLKRIVGQTESIDALVNVYQTHLSCLNPPHRPLGSLLFLGPTGTGKTRVVEGLAEVLFGKRTALTKVDCAEFQHSHEIAKIIGSPPGYLGHRETKPLLSNAVLNQYQNSSNQMNIVLFDEIEKASDALWNLLLGILDKGVLTLGDNTKADFTKSMIFMTSNLGTFEIQKIISGGLGFGIPKRGLIHNKIKETSILAAKKRFTPEFMNRLDKVVVFHNLEKEDMYRILELEIKEVQKLIMTSSPFALSVSKGTKDFILDNAVPSISENSSGARLIKRTLERLLVHPLANLMASGQIEPGDEITARLNKSRSEIEFVKTNITKEVLTASTGADK